MNTARTHVLTIQTPEGIAFALPLATPLSRLLAWFIDIVCLVGLTLLTARLLSIVNLISPDTAHALTTLVSFLISIGYGILLEWKCRGQTIGKRIFNLRVVDAQGLRLHPSQVVVRNLLRIVDMLPALYLVGGITAFLNARAQRLGDLVAHTVVIRHPRVLQPDVDTLFGGKYNSFREYPHLAARLRQLVSPTEASLALQAILRRDELEPAARVLLFREIAGHFRELVQFPPESIETLSDEQYTRNVVDVLFRTRAGAPAK